MGISWLEWLGYLASLIVLVSLLMSSIVKLRWINLTGSLMFSIYGFLIGSIPVGFMNGCIVIINIYFLVKIYRTREYFRILPINDHSSYLADFLEFYENGIRKYTDFGDLDFDRYAVRFFILRNMVPAGIFLASRHDENTLRIELDFVTPEYRDFRTGTYIFRDQKQYFLKRGYSRFICSATNPKHIRYLKKMGFREAPENGSGIYEKTI